jgi:hypothetical protein
MKINAFTSDESFFWHDIGNEALLSGESIQSAGDAGEITLAGQDAYAMTLLSAGDGTTGIEAAVNGECDDSYSLFRPQRDLAEADRGMSFVYLIMG